MKFASTNTRWWLQAIAVSALLAGLFLSGFLSGASGIKPVYAQAPRAGVTPRVPLNSALGLGSTQFLPPGITRRAFSAKGAAAADAKDLFGLGKAGQTRAQLGGENGFDVPEKTVDITRLPGSDEIHPFWSPDGTAVYFENNASFVGDPASEGYQLYRAPANTSGGVIPTGVTPIRLTNEPGANYRFPVLNTGGNRILFSRQRPGSTEFHLYLALTPSNPVPGNPGSFIPTVPDGNNLISLTNRDEPRGNPQAHIGGRTFVDVGRATFAGTSNIVFAARLAGVNGGPASPFHLFNVNLSDLSVLQLTDGTADEQNPVVSPDNRFIAFDSNATPGSYTTATVGTSVVALSNSTQSRRNVFAFGSSGQAASAAQVLTLDRGAYDNAQPAWSRLEPNDTANPNGALYYLAFASTRKPDNTAAPTTDIYFIVANNAAANQNSPLRPEAPGNAARLLDTADESFLFNDEYPTFPPFRNTLQIGFQSDRQGDQVKPNVPNSGFVKTPGTHDLFVATLFDIYAPTLMRWDSSSSTGDIVHINLGNTYNASPASAVRNRDQGLLPGSTVFFTVRAEDLESGINSVYLQFKNPNSKYQSAAQGGAGVEHKEYVPNAFTFTESNPGGSFTPLLWQNTVLGTPSNVGREYEAEAIGAADYNYYNHLINRGGKVGILPIPGSSDIAAFSGGTRLSNPSGPENNGIWLKLSPLPDAPQQGGPGGTLYGASWKVPAEASDWYMDVILFDNAVNPIAPSERNNWIIYDNVWGFSTALSLTAQPVDLLVVMDYALGQKFFTSRFGSTGDAFGRSINNLPRIQFGVESYFTDTEVSRYPDGQPAPFAPGGTTARSWDTSGAFAGHGGSTGSAGGGVGTPNTLGVDSYIDALLVNDSQVVDTGNARLASTNRYSLWRILSRGPVPPNLLTDYLPNRSASPPDQFLDANGVPLETTPRTVLQSNRMVIWASPFTANIFAGAGTIQDIQTQDNLRNYVNQGGRLFISGQDIGFALAGNGQSNTFFTDTLKAQFLSDRAGGATTITAAGSTLINSDAFGPDRTADHSYSQHNTNAPNSYSPPSGTLDLTHESLPTNGSGWIGDGSFAADAQAGLSTNTGFLDVVAPLPGAVAEYTYAGGAAIISSSNANGGRVVYASNGFEGIGSDHYIYNTGVISVHGRRAEIMHNITCAFRTATFSGRILDQNGTPVTDALVRAVRNGATENQLAAGTGFTDSNGNYTIFGLPPGSYEIYGYRAGYYTQKSVREIAHGASRATLNLVLRRAGPGGLGSGSGQSISSVFRADGVTPVPNITINAVRTDFGQNGSVQVGYTAITSDGTRSVDGVVLAAGQYSFGTQLPIGDYVVTANPKQIVDITGQLVDNPNYNSSFATVRVTNPPQAEVTLAAGTTVANNLVQIREGQTANLTFRLGSSPQQVTGRVVDQNGNPLAGVIIGGVISGANPPAVVVASAAPTDANGVYTLVTTGATPSADIPEGTYILTASLIGYSNGTATITVGGSGTLTVPDITLTQLQPGSVSGLVTGGTRGTTPIIGAVVTLFPYVNGAPIDAGKQTVTTTAVQNGANGYTFNYRFASVPPGQYVATARFLPTGAGDPNNTSIPALTATSAVFTVAESVETQGINLRLVPLQTYPAGLQMISLPNDYSGATPYQVFGLAPDADNDEDGTPGTANDQSIYNVFTVADWKVDQTGYAFFGQRFTSDPNYNPNLRFQPGTGYFVRFGDPTPVVLGGTGAPTNTFDKQITNPGWYIIGNPFGSLTLPIVQPVPLDLAKDVAFTYSVGGVQRNAVLLAQAVQDGAVQRVVFDFSGSQAGSQYRQTTSILPFQGYWFRAYVPMTVRFTYPGITTGGVTDLTRAAAQQGSNGEIMAAAVAEMMKANQTRAAAQPKSQGGLYRSVTSKSTSDWRLQIAARQGDLMDTDNSIGVSPNAKDGFDTSFDTVKPPMVGQDQTLYLTIDGSDDKGRSVSGFADNIRASGTSVKTWEFTVQTTSEQEVTLSWPNVNRLPRNLDPVLVDVQTGRRVSLRTGGASFRYQPKGRSAQRFRIEVNAAASRPLALTNVKTNRVLTGAGDGKAVQGAYRFSFTATQEADVTAEIQSMNGRTLRRMQTRAQASHETAFVWDGRDEAGSSLPAGTYIISLTAKDANTGALVRTRIPLLSVR